MSEVLEFSHDRNSTAERRKHARQRPNSLTYIELEKENGGIVLDASENGMSVQAVVGLTEDVLPQVRLRIADSKEWLEFRARVVWTRESRKVAGLQFEEMSERGRSQLQEWLAREASGIESEAAAVQDATEESVNSDANDSAESPAVHVSEIRPAPALVDYTDQSAANEVNIVELAGDVREQVPITVASGSGPAARVLSVPFSGISGALAVAIRAEAEGKELASAPRQQAAPSAARPRQAQGTAWVYVLLFALATGSLTAGWAAGRGKLAPVIDKLLGTLRQQQASAAMIETQPEATAPVSEIEVVDATGQRWNVSLQASAVSAAALPGQTAGAYSTEPNTKSGMNFQVWTLSAPRRSASSGAAEASAGTAPPALPALSERTDTPQIAEIASGDSTNAYTAVPKPENNTGVLKQGALLRRVEPEYPELARDQRVSGTVVLSAQVGVDGKVGKVSVISGPRLLTAAAENAVRQWRYAPTLLDGSPIETQVQISLIFHLPGESQ